MRQGMSLENRPVELPDRRLTRAVWPIVNNVACLRENDLSQVKSEMRLAELLLGR